MKRKDFWLTVLEVSSLHGLMTIAPGLWWGRTSWQGTYGRVSHLMADERKGTGSPYLRRTSHQLFNFLPQGPIF